MSVRVKSVGDWWEADPESKLFRLAERALAREWNVQPLLVREGGTMPVSPNCRCLMPSSQSSRPVFSNSVDKCLLELSGLWACSNGCGAIDA